MPRLSNRQIKADFWEDDDLLQLPRDARWLFEGLWHLAEDSGCVKDSPFQFKTKLFASPLDADLTVDRLADLRDELIAAGFLVRYTVERTDYLYIVNFHKHQAIKNPNAPKEVPLPPWITWETYESNPRAGRYVVVEQSVSGASSMVIPSSEFVSNASEQRQTDTSESRFSGSRFLGSRKEGEECEEGEAPASGASLRADPLKRVASHYQSRIGMLGPTQYEKLRFWLDDQGMEADVICAAIDEAIEQYEKTADPQKRRIGYIEGILRNWFNDGVRTLEDVRTRADPQTEEEHLAIIRAKLATVER